MIGLAVTLELVVLLNPMAGDQIYEEAPVALMLAEVPTQIVVCVPDVITVGEGLTVTITI